jgi:hypothetical protein
METSLVEYIVPTNHTYTVGTEIEYDVKKMEGHLLKDKQALSTEDTITDIKNVKKYKKLHIKKLFTKE